MHHPTTSKKSHLWVAANANEDPTAATTVPVVSSELLRSPFILVLLTVSALTCTSLAQNEAVVDELIDPVSLESSGGNLTVVFDDKRASNANTHFEAQHSSDITRWTGIENASIESHPLIPDRYILTAPDPGGERKFYRFIAYSTTATDQDGDGLSDTFEATLGTLAGKVDSDNDGFTDGIEFASGTDPLLASSKPNDGFPPRVEFLESIVEATEGETYQLQLKLDRSFTGTVAYEVWPTSTATAPDDYAALSGTIHVSGTSASIPITWVDDLEIQSQRILHLQLKTNPGQDYIPGTRDYVGIRLVDNDTWWHGLLTGEPDSPAGRSFIQRNFRLKCLNSGAIQQVNLVAGEGEDGLPSVDGSTSQTEGVIPAGDWPTTIHEKGPSDFHIVSQAISIPPPAGRFSEGGSLFGSQNDLVRTLELNATPGEQPYNEVTSVRVSGQWTETIASPSAPYLNRSNTGMFILVKALPELVQTP